MTGRLKDVAGQRFGKLVATERTQLKNHTTSVWKCVCDCGKETLVPLNYLTSGDTKSCGCLKWQGTPKDVRGEKFNKLTAIKQTKEKSSTGDYLWLCRCDCGKEVRFPIGRLNSGSAYSCGCENRLGTHNMYDTPTYVSWEKMLCRVRYEEYSYWYGEVEVCDRWDTRKGGSFENFLEDMGERPNGCSLNRVNGSKIYSPETCEWATYSMQSFDQRKSVLNTSGRTGVTFRKDRGKWEASITKNGKGIRLYYGESFEDACEAREKAEISLYGFVKE